MKYKASVAHCLLVLSILIATMEHVESRLNKLKFNSTDGLYSVIFPRELRQNSQFVVTTSAFKTVEPVFINVSLSGPSIKDNEIENFKKQIQLQNAQTESIIFKLGRLIAGEYKLSIKAAIGNKTYENDVLLDLQTKIYSGFIQTDKAIYKPNDKVQFRALLVDESLLPVTNEKINIYITDPHKNRIKQWLNITLDEGIFSESLQLSSNPIFGKYIIHMKSNQEIKTKEFEIGEYVLPQFDVKIIAPTVLSLNETTLPVKVESKYTYGKPVHGEAKVTLRQKYFYESYESKFWPEFESLKEFTIVKEINGNIDLEFNPRKNLKIPSSDDYEKKLEIEATVTDHVTKKSYKKVVEVDLIRLNYKINIKQHKYKPGLTFNGEIKVESPDDKIINDEGKNFKLGYRFDEKESFITNDYSIKNGLIKLEIDTPINSKKIIFRAEYKDKRFNVGIVEANPSKSSNYIQLNVVDPVTKKNKENSCNLGETVQIKLETTEPIKNFSYIVSVKNNLIFSKAIRNGEATNLYDLRIDAAYQLVPGFKVIAYYIRYDDEIVSDSLDVEVNNYARTPISIDTSKKQYQPGERAEINIKTNPKALVGVLGVDEGLLLLRSGNDLQQKDITDELYNYKSDYNSYSVPYLGAEIFISNNLNYVSNGINFNEYGMHAYLPEMGHYLRSTNLEESGLGNAYMSVSEKAQEFSRFSDESKFSIRKDFPETWLWDLKKANESDGIANFQAKVPDSITSWVLTAFSLDKNTGLALVKDPSKVSVFNPFFIKLDLPPFIVRKEILKLKVLVFNYFNEDKDVNVVLHLNENQFKLLGNFKSNEIVKVKANEVATVEFLIEPKIIGNLILKLDAITKDGKAGDKIEKVLKVKPEGATQYRNKAYLINGEDKQVFNIDFPSEAVSRSKIVKLSVLGDILSTSMENSHDLLRMPYGCGEQNMINFVPNIIILDYLNKTKKLTNEIKNKAIKFLEVGYQKELSYQHLDGSFSVFGEKDANGSTWLTAFVLKSFIHAKKYIAIDNKVIDKAIKYLIEKRNADGSFKETGKVYDKVLQGGLRNSENENSPALAAYVLTALHAAVSENKLNISDLKLTENYLIKSLDKIKLEVDAKDEDDPNRNNYYELSLISYALALVNSPEQDKAFDKLWQLKQEENNKVFFDLKPIDKKDNNDQFENTRHFYDYLPRSNSVEASSYALLTLLSKNDTTNTIKILNWLISKQNSNGGFASTQDTIIALEAISKLAPKISSPDNNLNVEFEIENYDSIKPRLTVNNSNSLEMQSYELDENNLEKEFKNELKGLIKSKGFGSSVVQVSYQYNILSKNEGQYFKLNTSINYNNDVANIKVSTKYLRPTTTNMVVIELFLPSGYELDLEKLEEIQKTTKDIKLIENRNKRSSAMVYLESVSNKEITEIEFSVLKVYEMDNLQPGYVNIYDYYRSNERATSFFILK